MEGWKSGVWWGRVGGVQWKSGGVGVVEGCKGRAGSTYLSGLGGPGPKPIVQGFKNRHIYKWSPS